MMGGGKESDNAAKPKYEAPVVVPLGELAHGHGGPAACHTGGEAGNCHQGNSAVTKCSIGGSG
jgi:hypothetical protein